MNLFDFLNKFGSRDHYFQIFIEYENKLKYKLRLYKTCFISISKVEIEIENYDEIYDAKLDKGNIKLYIDGKFHSFIIPRSFDYLIPVGPYNLYIPQNSHNVEIYNKLVKRRDINVDSRYPHKSKWRHFKRIRILSIK